EDSPPLTVTEVEKRTAHSVLKEYVLLNGVSRRVADAHLSALIHINRLSEWILKPDEVFHDLTFFLTHGLPPLEAPKSFGDAVALIEKLCFFTELEVSHGVALDSLNVYLAPFVENQDRRVLVEAFKAFLKSPSLGGGRILTLCLETSLPSYLKDVEAVGPGGEKKGTYQDYVAEAQTVNECLVEAMKETSLRRIPTHVQILFKLRNDAGERAAGEESFMELASKYALPYFAVCGSDEERVFTPDGLMIGVDRVKDDLKGYLRSGNLGTVHINIPRLHYESKGREERLLSLMESSVKTAVEAFKAKRNALLKVLKARMLPLLSGEKASYFSLEDAVCVLSFVGLNEVVEARTEKPLYTAEGARYASRILQFMGKLIEELEASSKLRIKLAQRPCEDGSERLARLDLEKYGRDALSAEPSSPPYYTDIPLIPLSRKISLNQRVEAEASTQRSLDGGCLTLIPLRRVSVEALRGLNGEVLKTGCKAYTYTMEISQCHRCGAISDGFQHTCPSCGVEHPTHLGRASALLQPTDMWPESRLRSSVNWIYHGL
ncbi:MAG: anaerobic ribonucleoside-triphosphate reductase, partial [Candidatus Bathyarchaeia archaeon]